MSIDLKTPEDISNMRIAGRLAAEVLEMIEEYVKPGISTGELDRICHDYTCSKAPSIRSGQVKIKSLPVVI